MTQVLYTLLTIHEIQAGPVILFFLEKSYSQEIPFFVVTLVARSSYVEL